MGGEENVKVCCRVRPLNKKEKKKGESAVVVVLNDQQVKIKGKAKKFNFDAVLGPDSSQQEVYETGAKKLIEDILKGYNGTIFAYGQTASGKTFTMEGELGDDEMKGIIPRIIEDLFNNTGKNKSTELSVKVAYFEIYNEKVRDLLDKSRTNLAIHEDKNRTPYVKNLTEVPCKSSGDINTLMKKGKKNRHTTGTNMNEHSSRSHSVFQMLVSQDDKENHKKTTGKLFLVDLAGSEKVSKSGAQGETLLEAQNINKSLSCLGNVISALTENNRAHVPYRDSKLTRILQQSLGGNARTTVIICVSPAAFNEQETTSTLNFGVRAKTIKNVVSANVEVSAAEWRNRFNKINTHMTKVKDLVIKLCKEAKKWREGKEPDKKERIDIDELMKLVEKGVDFDAKVEKEAKEEKEEEGDPNELRDQKRLKERLSRTSIAGKKDKGKDKDKDKDKKDKKGDKSKDNSLAEESEGEGVSGDTSDTSASAGEVPEDVLAVLRAEVDLKTKQLKEEKGKLSKLVDEKDEEISKLEEAKDHLEDKMKGSEKLLKDAQHDSKKAKDAIKAAQNEIMQYKERNRLLQGDSQEARGEVEQAKAAVKKKEEDVNRAAAETRAAKQEAADATGKVEKAKQEMEAQKQKIADQLSRLGDDVGDIGRLVSSDPKAAADFQSNPVNADKPDETLAALRVLLTKVKHHVEHNDGALKENQSGKNDNEKKNVEQMIMLNQAKERMAALEDDLEKSQGHLKEMEERINARNAKIAQLAKSNVDDDVDPDLDPDLQMLHDEHKKQLRYLHKELDDLKEKNDALMKEREQWQMMAETSKAEAQKASLASEGIAPMDTAADPVAGAEASSELPPGSGADDAEAPELAGSGGLPGAEPEGEMPRGDSEETPEASSGSGGEKVDPTEIEDDPERLSPGAAPGQTSEDDIQRLAQIRKDMDNALAKNRPPGKEGPEGEASGKEESGGGGKPPGAQEGGGADGGKGYPAGSMGQKQIAFLESTLDSVTKNNRALAAENRTLKVQRLPALQAMVKSLRTRCQELERLLKEEREKGGKMTR